MVWLYVLNALLMLGLPLALGAFLSRRLRVPWRLWGVGAATFILSQIGHLPFNAAALNPVLRGLPDNAWRVPLQALALGLSAGVFEEIARYLVYRFWIKDARQWRQGVMFGAGHGGVEAMIVGVLAGMTALNLVVLTTVDPATLGLAGEQLAEVERQVAAALSVPWYFALLGAVERAFAMTFHIAAAVLVLQAVRRRNLLWLLAAILWHTALNAVSLIVLDRAGPLWSEAALAALSLGSLAIIFWLRDPAVPPAPEPAPAPPPAPQPAPVAAPLAPPPLSAEALEKTRYQ
jgi:uncharacterized membrane protein YhfC